MIWSFAHLFENPFLSNEDLYFSKSRTLSARNGEWLTFDPMIKLNVEQLLNSPVDYNGIKYVNGAPVNFVDPSGDSLVHVGAAALGAYAIGKPLYDFARNVQKSIEAGEKINSKKEEVLNSYKNKDFKNVEIQHRELSKLKKELTKDLQETAVKGVELSQKINNLGVKHGTKNAIK